MAERPMLRSVEGAAALPIPNEFIDPLIYQSMCVDGFVATQVARGFSSTTIDNGIGELERFLRLAGRAAAQLSRIARPSDIVPEVRVTSCCNAPAGADEVIR